MSKQLIPINGCWVRFVPDSELMDSSGLYGNSLKNLPKGRVLDSKVTDETVELYCHFLEGKKWVERQYLASGFDIGDVVQDVPQSNTQRTLGLGVVQAQRILTKHHQALVHLQESGELIWVPFENLKKIKSVRDRYVRQETGVDNPAEHFRLRLLSYALESWNLITGALDRLDVDPLPHQIQLVHKILSSGNMNWLIADDVGLGKTIEMGLLLAALKRRKQARRVLIVAPAGLVLQWQDEMKFKFDETYEIYGRDFNINDSEHWKLHEKVIVSLDLAKKEKHLDAFVNSGYWDVIIFDEAHKISRVPKGKKTERYVLAEQMRTLTDAFLFLTATPHQGKTDRFAALLELVRPDLGRELYALNHNPQIVSEVILRNKKSEVTDAEGNFIFNGHDTHLHPVEPSEYTVEFSRALDSYLRNGYGASDRVGGKKGRAIGFVMTIFRKLSSSSIAAIERSLNNRSMKLSGKSLDVNIEIPEMDLYESGDDQDDIEEYDMISSGEEFFAHESEQLKELILLAKKVKRRDEKLSTFIDKAIRPLIDADKKVLIFSEYRGTQDYIVNAILKNFPSEPEPLLINGSMTLDEKLESIENFRERSRFLVSTEAGGEGLNLQEGCHVMVNYDLPWNPSRLVQRIGRLYRYGQKDRVLVINLQTKDNFDNNMLGLLLNKVSDIASDMSPVSDEFHEGLHVEIIGEILDHLDIEDLLEKSKFGSIDRTDEQLDEAIDRAKKARDLQEDILSYAGGYDPDAMKGLIGLSIEHVEAFTKGMLAVLNMPIRSATHKGKIINIQLPDSLIGEFTEFGQKQNISLCFDRELARYKSHVYMMDFESTFFSKLINEAQQEVFDGYAAVVDIKNYNKVSAFKLKWQTSQGKLASEEFHAYYLDDDNNWNSADDKFSNWLKEPAYSYPDISKNINERVRTIKSAVSYAEQNLSTNCNSFRHPNDIVDIAFADVVENE
tara:strand:+ start:203580 stop:206441 length:2862 start_codon:yes stop_codon:yes gene_type:complete